MTTLVKKPPSWPIGDLVQSSNEIIDRVSPLANSDEELSKFQSLVESFTTSNESDQMQSALKAFAEENGDRWFQKLWDQMYLNWRGPLPIAMNFYLEISLEEQETFSPLEKASQAIVAIKNFAFNIHDKSLPQENLRDTPLCMDPYTRMFSIRLANKDLDSLEVSKVIDNTVNVLILSNGKMFELSLDRSSQPKDVQKALQKIPRHSSCSIGPITTLPRDRASKLWKEILLDEVNLQNFERLKKAHFVVCLDCNSEATLSPFEKSLLTGSSTNRFFDRSLQLIVGKKQIGLNIEHTPCDAGPWLTLCDVIRKSFSSEEPSQSQEILISELQWNLSSSLANEIEDAETQFKSETDRLSVTKIQLKGFGRDAIKTLKISPDAFFQLSYQIALWKTLKEKVSTYESVSMRHYLFGRTECTRPCTEQAFRLAESFDQLTDEKLILLIEDAAKAHTARIIRCQKNHGGEKHFFALQAMAKNGVYPKFQQVLEHPLYQRLKYDRLSTSNSSNEAIQGFGFGPVVENGISVGYTINKENSILNVSFFKTSQKEGCAFLKALEETTTKLKYLLTQKH